MTAWEEFCALRWAAIKTRRAARGDHHSDDYLGVPPAYERPIASAAIPAGWWVLPLPGSESATRWHVFTGDLRWSPEFRSVVLTFACGHVAELWGTTVAQEAVPDAPCRLCSAALGRAWTRMPTGIVVNGEAIPAS